MNGKTMEMWSEKKGCVLFLVLRRHAGSVGGRGDGLLLERDSQVQGLFSSAFIEFMIFRVTEDKWAWANDYSYHLLSRVSFLHRFTQTLSQKITQLFPLLYVLVSPSCHAIMDREYNLLLHFSLWPSLLLYPPFIEQILPCAKWSHCAHGNYRSPCPRGLR